MVITGNKVQELFKKAKANNFARAGPTKDTNFGIEPHEYVIPNSTSGA